MMASTDDGDTPEEHVNDDASLGLWASPELLKSTCEDVGDLWCHRTIATLDEPPSSLIFFRDYVSKNVPCIIRGVISGAGGNEEPLTLTLDDLVEICRGDEDSMSLSVDVTPDGHGDCVRTVQCDSSDARKRMFVTPEQRSTTLPEFRDELRCRPSPLCDASALDDDGRHVLTLANDDDGDDTAAGGSSSADQERRSGSKPSGIVYYSKQNDCLRTELRPLFDKQIVPETIPFAEKAFGTGPPDAVNLWIGNEYAVSSMHKDHYENLFYVLSGEKVFTLCPPSDAPLLYQSEFESGSFCQNESGEWTVLPDERGVPDGREEPPKVQWIEADVERRQHDGRYPLLSFAHPLQVHVRQGEMLYLPSLWFHKVSQTCETVGVNWWFDMKFDSPLWCYFNFLQQLQIKRSVEVEDPRD